MVNKNLRRIPEVFLIYYEAFSKSLNQSAFWPEEDKFLMDYCDDYIDRAHQYFCQKRRS